MPTEPPTVTILIVEDVPELRRSLLRSLEADGRRFLEAGDAASATTHLDAGPPAVVLLDLTIPAVPGGAESRDVGLALLAGLMADHPETIVIVLTGSSDEPVVIEATRKGAVKFLVKPPKPAELEGAVAAACTAAARGPGAGTVSATQDDPEIQLIGTSQAMVDVMARIARVATSLVPVLITGETGTGKERVAKALHLYSKRRDGPFITVDCASLSPALLESELFGHEKGAFTGAESSRPGRFELASGGTLFLDEIGNMSKETQTKLLRAVESGKGLRVGGTREISWDARIVSATNADLEVMVTTDRFKHDLLERLDGEQIRLPALRHRREDIRPLTRHLMGRLPEGSDLRISEAALAVLEAADWPGNVRELFMAIRRAAAYCREGVIQPEDLPDSVRSSGPLSAVGIGPTSGKDGLVSMDELRKRYARHAMAVCANNQSEAARLLGIDRGTLSSLLKDG